MKSLTNNMNKCLLNIKESSKLFYKFILFILSQNECISYLKIYTDCSVLLIFIKDKKKYKLTSVFYNMKIEFFYLSSYILHVLASDNSGSSNDSESDSSTGSNISQGFDRFDESAYIWSEFSYVLLPLNNEIDETEKKINKTAIILKHPINSKQRVQCRNNKELHFILKYEQIVFKLKDGAYYRPSSLLSVLANIKSTIADADAIAKEIPKPYIQEFSKNVLKFITLFAEENLHHDFKTKYKDIICLTHSFFILLRNELDKYINYESKYIQNELSLAEKNKDKTTLEQGEEIGKINNQKQTKPYKKTTALNI